MQERIFIESVNMIRSWSIWQKILVDFRPIVFSLKQSKSIGIKEDRMLVAHF